VSIPPSNEGSVDTADNYMPSYKAATNVY